MHPHRRYKWWVWRLFQVQQLTRNLPGAGDSGFTPLHYAARAGKLEAAALLIQHGAPSWNRNVAGGSAADMRMEPETDSN